jgi:hypothetical protein
MDVKGKFMAYCLEELRKTMKYARLAGALVKI